MAAPETPITRVVVIGLIFISVVFFIIYEIHRFARLSEQLRINVRSWPRRTFCPALPNVSG